MTPASERTASERLGDVALVLAIAGGLFLLSGVVRAYPGRYELRLAVQVAGFGAAAASPECFAAGVLSLWTTGRRGRLVRALATLELGLIAALIPLTAVVNHDSVFARDSSYGLYFLAPWMLTVTGLALIVRRRASVEPSGA